MAKDRSVSVGRGAVGSAIVTGNRNRVIVKYTKVTLPPPESVDIKATIAALEQQLTGLNTLDRTKIKNALGEAAEDVAKESPNRDEIGAALKRAVDYASKADDFAEKTADLMPNLLAACSWLGTAGRSILAMLGLSV